MKNPRSFGAGIFTAVVFSSLIAPVVAFGMGTSVRVPTVQYFYSDAAVIFAGQSTILRWGSVNTTSCNTPTGTVTGMESVSPVVTTTYKLTCTGTAGSASKSITITVTPLPSSTTSVANQHKSTTSTTSQLASSYEAFESLLSSLKTQLTVHLGLLRH